MWPVLEKSREMGHITQFMIFGTSAKSRNVGTSCLSANVKVFDRLGGGRGIGHINIHLHGLLVIYIY